MLLLLLLLLVGSGSFLRFVRVGPSSEVAAWTGEDGTDGRREGGTKRHKGERVEGKVGNDVENERRRGRRRKATAYFAPV